jgi:hypothetical protein
VFLGRPVFGEVFLERVPFQDIPSEINQSAEWLLNNFEKRVCAAQQPPLKISKFRN